MRVLPFATMTVRLQSRDVLHQPQDLITLACVRRSDLG
jgi:hypothetical protein